MRRAWRQCRRRVHGGGCGWTIGQFRRCAAIDRGRENGDGTIRRLRWTVAEVLVRASDQIDAKGLLIVYG